MHHECIFDTALVVITLAPSVTSSVTANSISQNSFPVLLRAICRGEEAVRDLQGGSEAEARISRVSTPSLLQRVARGLPACGWQASLRCGPASLPLLQHLLLVKQGSACSV